MPCQVGTPQHGSLHIAALEKRLKFPRLRMMATHSFIFLRFTTQSYRTCRRAQVGLTSQTDMYAKYILKPNINGSQIQENSLKTYSSKSVILNFFPPPLPI